VKRAFKQITTPSSSGGLGNNFENRVQASFAVLMLANGFSPCLPSWPIYKIKLQGKYEGFETDDLIVYVKDQYSDKKAKLLGQVKHSLCITNNNSDFNDVIRAAWRDFNNSSLFNAEAGDIIALITCPLSSTDTNNVRALLRQAEHSYDSDDFLMRVEKEIFTSNRQREKLKVFKNVLKKANDNNEISNDQLWLFLKSFRLLIYDLDIEGVIISLLRTILQQHTLGDVEGILAKLIEIAAWENENAGYITLESISDEIRSKFSVKPMEVIPKKFTIKSDEVDWNISQYGQELSYMALLGAWNENSEYDVDIVKKLMGKSDADWIRIYRDILQLQNSPLDLKNSIWRIKDQSSMWDIFAPRMFDETLNIFCECIVEVLSEKDPQFTLPTEKRYAASIYGKNLNYSYPLRKGLANSLALIGCYPEKLKRGTDNKAELITSQCISKILDDADWVLWASLKDLLPTIAEASPQAFLEAVKKGLDSSDAPFLTLFKQECGGITGRNYLTGLLWALEGLAWDESLLVQVTMILGELANIDTGGNWGNRPKNSLTTIFLPWYPQTLAQVSKRFAAIEVLIKEFPSVAWSLLISLLPNNHQTSMGSKKPLYRNHISNDWKPDISNKDYWNQISAYAEYAVELANNDPQKLQEIIGSLGNLPEKSFNKALLQLKSCSKMIGEDEKVALWTKLLHFTKRHERFPDANWSLDSSIIKRIKETMVVLQPTSPINYYQFLFSNRDWELYEKDDENEDWQTQSNRLEERRKSALLEIIEFGGTNSLCDFVKKVEQPQKVGSTLAGFADKSYDKLFLPNFMLNEETSIDIFVSAYIYRKYFHIGWEWLNTLEIDKWDDCQKIEFFLRVPISSEVWNLIDKSFCNLKTQYWKRVNVNVYTVNISDLGVVIDNLIEFDRPLAAVNCFHHYIFEKVSFDKDKLVNALLCGISSSESISAIDQYNFVELIKFLQNDETVNEDNLFRIEWGYFNLLNKYDGAPHITLDKKLANDPDFFNDIICLVYRSKDDNTQSHDDIDDVTRAIARNAYTLLTEWQTPPGVDSDGNFDSNQFMNWLVNVKSLCDESGRLDAALTYIGEVLFYTPPEIDGFWINKVVAEVLNEKDAERIRNGFKLKVYNSRGVHSVDPTGKPEKKLASKYQVHAEETENAGYPRFANTLREIARNYERDAERIISEHLLPEDEI